MQFDDSPARLFLSYVDGEATLDDVWEHPAYGVARDHAALLGGDLTRDDVTAAVAGDETSVVDIDALRDDRAAIEQLLETIGENDAEWCDRITSHLERVIPDADTDDLPVYLGIGYETGIGLADGVYLDVSDPFYREQPDRVPATALHESTHVCYDRVHDLADRMAAHSLDSSEGQRAFFATLFHTEAYAVYAAADLWRSDGDVEAGENPMCEDYRVLADENRVRAHVERYDSVREKLASDTPLSRETLFDRTFGGPRLPYRVGCAMLRRIEVEHGIEAVREAFTVPPETFVAEYDAVLDAYRT